MSLEAIKYTTGRLEILDQLLLPHERKYIQISNTEDSWKAIHQMQVRGAPAIAIVGCLGLAVELRSKNIDMLSKETMRDFVKDRLDYLVTSRPTAVNMKQFAEMFKTLATKLCSDPQHTVQTMFHKFLNEVELILDDDKTINRSIGLNGALDILNNVSKNPTILTHCNTGSLATGGYGTALGVIRCLHEKEALLHVYCTETRPYNQGARLTAYELVHDNIPATLICDSMVASAMKTHNISAVVVGADRVVANGDVANKIGTYQLAVVAKNFNIPFYVACPISSIDFKMNCGSEIPIEERPHKEMTFVNGFRIAAPGINCWNPAFDVTPCELVTGGIITEQGVFPANKLSQISK